MNFKRVLLTTAIVLAMSPWISFTTPTVANAQEDSSMADDGAAGAQDNSAVAGQDDVVSTDDVAGPADYVGDWSGMIQDRRLGQGSIDLSIQLLQPKHGKPKLKGTYEIVLAGRDRKGKLNPKVDSTGAVKLSFGFRIANMVCGVKATANLISANEMTGTYKAGGCRSSGTFDVSK
ncbi:MAG TPA: hypothetical protein VEU51_03085 [Candidatus Acidoferrales bacterium]|nr:hypothetical protein [Candidatus Acidoferrales bacterium]